MRRRKPLRIKKAYDTYEFKGGSAGFVKLKVNGKEKRLVSSVIRFTKRRDAS